MKDVKIDVEALKKLEIISKMQVTTRLLGRYRSAFRGKGLEFESYRPYTEADDATLIDWKASARANELLIKEFIEERNLNVFFLFDVSNSMLFGSIPRLKHEYAASLTATLSYAILKAGDGVGLGLFTDSITKRIDPNIGDKQFFNILKILSSIKNYGGMYNLSRPLRLCLSYLPRSSTIIIVSDFIGLENNWEKTLKLAAKKFDVIGIMIRDPRDKELLDEDVGHIIIGDPFSEKMLSIIPNEINADYKRYVKNREEEIKKTFISSECDFLSLTTTQEFILPVIKLFKRRETKLR